MGLRSKMLDWVTGCSKLSYGALLVGWLVVVARGLYLARHLFTLFYLSVKGIMNQLIIALEGARVSLVHDQAVLVATENLCFID